jgi:protein-L-isoaspartate(D-aspartate) O-methyltransferase
MTAQLDRKRRRDGSAAERLRARMVERQIAGRDVDDERVLDAMRAVPRHVFVPAVSLRQAYADGPLAIGQGQTISQPYVVAWMTQQLEIEPGDRVLEVGTGCGYAAAVLAEMAGEVWTIERHPELADRARHVLARLGYDHVTVVVADGSTGYRAAAPYDAIIVAAAAPRVPDALVDQLADGGRLVLPVDRGSGQELLRVRKRGSEVQRSSLGGVRFVPLIGEQGKRPPGPR